MEYRERKEILTVQHQNNLVILEMLHLGSPIRFLYKDEALMREYHFLNHRQKVDKVFGGRCTLRMPSKASLTITNLK